MNSLRKRLPSLQSIGYVFCASILVVQAWEFYNLFYNIPALQHRESTWDLLGIVAIVQVFAFFESLVVCLLLAGLAILLPARLMRQQFVAQAAGLMLVSAAWTIGVHFSGQPMTTWEASRLWLWLGLYLVSIALVWWVIQRFSWLERGIQRVLESATVLAWVYAFISLMGLVIILIRNFL